MRKIYECLAGLLIVLAALPATAQTITVGSLTPLGPFCSGATPSLAFTTGGMAFSGTQTFTAEISDATGAFPGTSIGTTSGTGGGTISLTALPTVAATNALYKIRIVATPDNITSGNTASLTIMPVPAPTITPAPAGSVCTGATVTYTTEGGMSDYTWTYSGTLNTDYTVLAGTGTSSSSTATVTWLTAGPQSASVNYSNGACMAPVAATAATTVVDPPMPTFTTPASTSACVGSTVTYTTQAGMSNYVWTISGAAADYVLTPGTGTSSTEIATITWLTPGSRTVTVNYSNGSCTGASAASFTTNVTAIPMPTFTSPGAVGLCIGVPVNYTTQAGKSNYIWTISGPPAEYILAPGTGTTGTSTATITWLTGGSKTVTVNYTDGICTGAAPASATNTVNATPVVSFAVQPGATSCINTPLTYTTQSGPGIGAYVWTFSGTAGVDYTLVSGGTLTSNTAVVTWLTNTPSANKTVTVNYTDGNSCSGLSAASNTTTIISAVTTPVFSGTPIAPRCQGGGTVTYTATASNTSGPITYALDATTAAFPGNSILGGTVTYAANWSGSTTITATAPGCAPKMASVTVVTTPSVTTPLFNAGVTPTRCQGGPNVSYAATASNTSGPITYQLDATTAAFPGNSIDAAGTVIYAAGWAGNTIITANAPGCSPKSANYNVATVGIPTFGALGTASSRCQGYALVPYPATSVNSTSISYTLSGGCATCGVSSTGVVSFDPLFNTAGTNGSPGSGTVIVTASAAGCATNLTSTHTITVNAGVGPVSFNSPQLTPCTNSTVTYSATAANATGYTYSINTSATNATIGASSGVATFKPGFVGTGTITVVASGCNGSTTKDVNVTVQPGVTTPQFNAGPQDTICQAPGIVSYVATASNTTTLPAITYSITPAAAGSISAGGLLNYNSGFAGGTAQPVVITASATGCDATKTNTFTVIVKPTVSAPTFGALGATSTRKQGSAIVTYTATAANASSIAYQLSPAAAGNILSNNGQVTYASTFSGTAQITATATGCNGTPSAIHTVTVVQTPVFALGGSSTRCQGGGMVSYAANTPNTPLATIAYTLTTLPNDPLTTINTSTGMVNYSATFSGTATIGATATQNGVTTDIAQHVATVNVAPRLTTPTPTSKTICSGDSTKIALVSTTGASSYSWTLGAGFGITGQSTGTVNVIDQVLTDTSGSAPDFLYYIVTVTSAAPASCQSVVKDSIKVTVNPKPRLTPIGALNICSEDIINIGLGASTPSNFSWDYTAPAKITNIFSGVASTGGSINQSPQNTDVSASPTSATFTYNIKPTSLQGCVGNISTASVTVNPLPVVSFTGGASKTICSNQPTNITLNANIGSTFVYTAGTITSLGLISGQKDSIGNFINQVLKNSSFVVADSIAYSVTATTTSLPACTGKPGIVRVRVNPLPSITSTLTDSVCSGVMTTTPLTASIPSTYAWALGTNPAGILGQTALPTSTPLTNINQTLVNPSNIDPGFVQYIVTPTSVSLPACVGASKTVTVKVNPSPKLKSDSVRSICSNGILSYMPESSVTAGTTIFTYDRTSGIPTIANQFQKTTTGIADSLSTNYILTPADVDYSFTLTSAAGCPLSGQHLKVTVNPTPDTPGISIFPRTKLCSGATAMNFSASRVPAASEYFRWSTTNAAPPIQKVDSSFSQNALIGFPNAGNAVVTVESFSRGFGCKGKASNKQMPVNSAGGSQSINVVQFAGNLVAQVNGAKAYQWGFDRRSDLDSTMLAGETTQSYDTRKGFDKNANYYWVMVTFPDDCVQKAYYNGVALGVQAPAAEAAEMRVYPNPVQDVVTLEMVQGSTKDLVYEVYDLAGRRMAQVSSNTAKTRIPVSELAPGYYTIICTQAGVRIAASRFIKN